MFLPFRSISFLMVLLGIVVVAGGLIQVIGNSGLVMAPGELSRVVISGGGFVVGVLLCGYGLARIANPGLK